MSKTTGTLVSPSEAADVFGPDALRYFLLREIPFDKDGDFSWESYSARYNADLANNLGNLLSRVVTMIQKYCAGSIPEPDASLALSETIRKQAEETRKQYDSFMQELRFSSAFDSVWKLLDSMNVFIEETMPWQLAKDTAKASELDTVLYTLAEGLRMVSYLIFPVMPLKSLEMLAQLGIAKTAFGLSFDDIESWGGIAPGHQIGEKKVLFPKKELELEE